MLRFTTNKCNDLIMHNSCITIYHVKFTADTSIRVIMMCVWDCVRLDGVDDEQRTNNKNIENTRSFFGSFMIYHYYLSEFLCFFLSGSLLAGRIVLVEFVLLQFTSVTICAQSHARHTYTTARAHIYTRDVHVSTRKTATELLVCCSLRPFALIAFGACSLSVWPRAFIVWPQSQHNPFSAPGGSATGYRNRIIVVHRLTNWWYDRSRLTPTHTLALGVCVCARLRLHGAHGCTTHVNYQNINIISFYFLFLVYFFSIIVVSSSSSSCCFVRPQHCNRIHKYKIVEAYGSATMHRTFEMRRFSFLDFLLEHVLVFGDANAYAGDRWCTLRHCTGTDGVSQCVRGSHIRVFSCLVLIELESRGQRQ